MNHELNITLPPPALSAEMPRSAARQRLVDLYELTKPRMNFLVVVTTAVGFFMATKTSFNVARLVHTLLGTALTAASASILNQYVERQYDARMPRTRNRPLPAGRIAPHEALVFAMLAGVVGVSYLALAVNLLTAGLGLLTLLSYVLVYTPLKRISTLNTVVGAVPGALPPVMGFTAVHNMISPEALALFAILFFWQMPHFLAIAILYRSDYAAGGFKMLPVVDRELTSTSRQIILYTVALIAVTIVPVGLHMAGAAYFCMAVLMGLAFLTFGVSVAATKTRTDARKLFFASIIYLPLLLAALMLDKSRSF